MMATFAAGFVVVWVAVALYVGGIARRQRRLRDEVDLLQRQLAAGNPREPRVRDAA